MFVIGIPSYVFINRPEQNAIIHIIVIDSCALGFCCLFWALEADCFLVLSQLVDGSANACRLFLIPVVIGSAMPQVTSQSAMPPVVEEQVNSTPNSKCDAPLGVTLGTPLWISTDYRIHECLQKALLRALVLGVLGSRGGHGRPK